MISIATSSQVLTTTSEEFRGSEPSASCSLRVVIITLLFGISAATSIEALTTIVRVASSSSFISTSF